jgi:hypothetical protein
MIDQTTCTIDMVSVHAVGAKANNEELHLSKRPLNITDARVRELLLQYFLTPFSKPEFYTFLSSDDDGGKNPVQGLVSQIVHDKQSLHEVSVKLATHLFHLPENSQLTRGDFFVACFSNITLEDEIADAVGIFKAESTQTFLKLDNLQDEFYVQCENGIDIHHLEKCCLILNTGRQDEYTVCAVDTSCKSLDESPWLHEFLRIQPRNDNFHATEDAMKMTKEFVAHRLADESAVTKPDQIDMLHRSVDYFKTHETFDQGEFEHHVFHDPSIIDSFHQYRDEYGQQNNVEMNHAFDISPQAVKKQSKIFKTILKLDKNFHVYIHGNRGMIEQGMEDDGRKFYKIYYEHEA